METRLVPKRHELPPMMLAILECLAPVLAEQQKQIEDLKAMLAPKGIGAPGTVTIDPAVVQFVKDYCWKIETDVDELKRESMQWKGVYNPDTAYAKGSVVTRGGSWWIAECTIEPNEMPGHDGTNWKLCVKGDRREKPR